MYHVRTTEVFYATQIKHCCFYLQKGIYPDLLATSGDYLRVWQQAADGDTRIACLLNNVSEIVLYD